MKRWLRSQEQVSWKGPNLGSSQQPHWLMTTCDSNSRRSDASGLHSHSHRHRNTYSHIIKDQINRFYKKGSCLWFIHAGDGLSSQLFPGYIAAFEYSTDGCWILLVHGSVEPWWYTIVFSMVKYNSAVVLNWELQTCPFLLSFLSVFVWHILWLC